MNSTLHNERPDLFIVLDFGGSLTKGLYMGSDQKPKLLAMEPEVIEVPKSSIGKYESRKMGMSVATPADSAWCGVGEEYWAVGYLAQSQFNANPGLSQLKHERAFPKVLAAVWAAAQFLELSNSFKAAIGILLPPGEYDNGEHLRRRIEAALQEFETPTGKLKVALTHFDCKPEGGGVYMMRSLSYQNKDAFRRKTIAVVMAGYRNASVLLAQRGQVVKRLTSDLGFVKLVEKVVAGNNWEVNRLVKAIVLAGDRPDMTQLVPVLRASTELERKGELLRLREILVTSRQEYALSLKSWLNEVLPRNVDEVVLCGGTADYLRCELSEHFARSSIVWHGVELPEELRNCGLGMRLCDVYGMYEYLRKVVAVSVPKRSRAKKKKEAIVPAPEATSA